MTDKDEWGPVIKGPFHLGKPDFLDGDRGWVMVTWNNAGQAAYPANCIYGWEDSIKAIQLRKNHPYYATMVKDDTPPATPTDYDMRSHAVALANGNLTLAREIYTFLKGDAE